MKEISKTKLNQLSKAELQTKRMNALKGGSGTCYCSCAPNCSCSGALGNLLSDGNADSNPLGKVDMTSDWW